jgi:hypothetical protein
MGRGRERTSLALLTIIKIKMLPCVEAARRIGPQPYARQQAPEVAGKACRFTDMHQDLLSYCFLATMTTRCLPTQMPLSALFCSLYVTRHGRSLMES